MGRVVAVIAQHAPAFPDGFGHSPVVIEPNGNSRYTTLLDGLDALVRDHRLPPYHPLSLYVAGGPRRSLWGTADRGVEHALVEALNDASAQGEPVALVIDGADRSDPATLRLVLRAANRPGWLKVPLLLVFHEIPDQGPVKNAADALGAEPIRKVASGPVSIDVPQEHKVLLRAAAWLGSPFNAKALAALTDTTPLAVLLALQDAADQGVALHDKGAGHFTLPDALSDALGRDLLPSLTEAWVAADLAGQSHHDDDEPERGISAARRAWLSDRRLDAVAFAQQAVDTDDDDEAVAALADLAWFHLSMSNLDEATECANRLVSLTQANVPPEIHTQALLLRAMVLQAVGGDHIAGALADVREASNRTDDPVEKALRLADEAALSVAANDVPAGARCLSRARALLMQDTSTEAALAIAESNLLTGRLPLFAKNRGETAVLASAARHARKAVDVWEPLGRSSDLAIVSRTLGDLERLAGRGTSAMKRYSEAVHLQRDIGDDVGLAITTHSLAEVLADVGSLNEAVSVLADSVGLNSRTGAVGGLSQNRETVESLRAHSLGNLGVQRALDTLAGRIDGAMERGVIR
ncbi:MAG: tetratricopeptide (TPR) repeat protein [Myxococcota bacterium]|jgi:tetratricopeptide (TPR) repeat protein